MQIKSFTYFFLLLILSCGLNEEELEEQELDNRLSNIITQNNLNPLNGSSEPSSPLVHLGAALFSDKNLSGNRDISCQTCHHPNHGSADGLPLSIGTGAFGLGPSRRQINGLSQVIRRNSPSLFNLGIPNQTHAFFDGRVNKNGSIWITPVNDISGRTPSRSDITAVFTHVYDAQGLFPILSIEEMLGQSNDLSSLGDEVAVWERILSTRLLNQTSYQTLFQDAYPGVALSDFNPGHIGRALGAFMTFKFRAHQTPFDRYLSGDKGALSLAEKRGMLVFYGSGRCQVCHSGPLLTDNNFESIAIPQIGTSPLTDDRGLEEFTGDSRDRYFFKTPSLRNIALTAPYMHNGAFQTLDEVVNHYRNVGASLNNYRLPASYQNHYQASLVVDTSFSRNSQRLNQVPRFLRRGLRLSRSEREDLVEFLQKSLTDESFRGR